MQLKLANLVYILVFLLSSVLSAANAQPSAPGQVLKTVTLNFNSETVIQDRFSSIRTARFKSIQEWVKQNDPDIIFIQEGWNFRGIPSMIVPLADAIGYDYTYRVGEGFPFVFADSNGVLVKKSLQLSQRTSFELPYGKGEIGNGNGWVVPLGANSYAVGGKITLADGSTMYLYSTHLISNGEVGAQAGLEAIHSTIMSQAHENGENADQVRSMIAGDFNSTPDAAAPVAIRALGYQDTFAEAHPGLGSDPRACTNCMDPTVPYFDPMTVSPFQFPKQVSLGGSERFDYIMARGPQIKTLASTVIFTRPLNNVWMSDHNGVMSTIAVGAVPSTVSYPNPMRDSDNTEKTLVIHLNEDNLYCGSLWHCSTTLPDADISASMGITFINETKGYVHLKLKGSGHIWNQDHITLAPAEVAAFFFDPNESYEFKAHQLFTRRKLYGGLNASMK